MIERIRPLLQRVLPQRRLALAGGAARPSAVMPQYTAQGFLRRHRLACYVGLVLAGLIYGFVFAVWGRVLMLQLAIPLILMAVVVLWLLPVTERPPVVALERLTLAFIVGLLAWPDYLAIDQPGLPWITLIRIIGLPLVIVLLICTSVSVRFRAEMKHVLSAVPAVTKMFVIFTIMCGLSIGLSSDIGNSFNKFIVAQLTWTAIFLAACYVYRRPGRVTQLVLWLWAVAMIDCIGGLYEVRYSVVPWAGRVPAFLQVDDDTVQRILHGGMRAATGIYRVQSRFTTSLGFGEFLALVTPLILHVMVMSRGTIRRLAAAASLPLICYIVIKTDSRLAFIGFCGSLLGYLLVWGALRWKNNTRSLFGPAIVVSYPITIIAFLVASRYIGRLRAMVWGTGAHSASNEAREEMYRRGIPMVIKNPVGHGIGQGAITLGYTNGAGVLTIDTYYLAIALEMGVVGFVTFYGMILVSIWQAGKTTLKSTDPEVLYAAPLAIGLINFFIGKSVFSQIENQPLVFLMMGIIMALVCRQKDAEKEAQAAAAGRAIEGTSTTAT